MVARATKRVKEAHKATQFRADARYTRWTMPVVVSLLRAVNVGGHSVVKMADLRALYQSLNFKDVQTYVQSGNVVFRANEKDLAKLAKRIHGEIAKRFGVMPGVMLRTTAEVRDVVRRNPFGKRKDIEPTKLHVSFLHAT